MEIHCTYSISLGYRFLWSMLISRDALVGLGANFDMSLFSKLTPISDCLRFQILIPLEFY